MRGVVLGLEAIAVLVPDFQTLGLIMPTFFSLYRCALTLGFPGTRDINADLLISLGFGYVVAVALNLAVTLPARPNHAPVSHPALRKTQFVCAGAEVRPAPSFDPRYLP
jgi:hypothetical protein